MSKLIKLPASALYVPEGELATFTRRFKCNPDELGTVLLTVSDEAYQEAQTTLITTGEDDYSYTSLEYGTSSDEFDPIIPRGLIRAQHNMPIVFSVVRATLTRRFGKPRIHLHTSNGYSRWWLYYHLEKVPSVASILPGIRFRITQ